LKLVLLGHTRTPLDFATSSMQTANNKDSPVYVTFLSLCHATSCIFDCLKIDFHMKFLSSQIMCWG
jgi:hypothetical protein